VVVFIIQAIKFGSFGGHGDMIGSSGLVDFSNSDNNGSGNGKWFK
jgi:hypothetical protein